MSGVTVKGSMPKPGQILAVLDHEAKVALGHAKDITLPAVRAEAPGGLGAALNGSVRKTATGYRAVIAPPRGKKYGPSGATGAQVVRWVTRGTGIYRRGPGPKRRITAKRSLRRMTLPGGHRVLSVRGQKPNPFIARAEARSAAAVARAIESGAHAAARKLRRL